MLLPGSCVLLLQPTLTQKLCQQQQVVLERDLWEAAPHLDFFLRGWVPGGR